MAISRVLPKDARATRASYKTSKDARNTSKKEVGKNKK